MKANKTLIMSADGENILFYKNEGINKGIEKLNIEYHQEIPNKQDIVTDRPGMKKMGKGSGSMKTATHGYQPSDNPKEDMKVDFLRKGVSVMHDMAVKDDYKRIVLIAPPSSLGEIRKLVKSSLKEKIIGEISKNMTNSSVKEVERSLDDVMAY